MKLKYDVVPDIITGKDLDYLCDMFNWNYYAYKASIESKNICDNKDSLKMLDKSIKLFENNMLAIVDILKRGGVK